MRNYIKELTVIDIVKFTHHIINDNYLSSTLLSIKNLDQTPSHYRVNLSGGPTPDEYIILDICGAKCSFASEEENKKITHAWCEFMIEKFGEKFLLDYYNANKQMISDEYHKKIGELNMQFSKLNNHIRNQEK